MSMNAIEEYAVRLVATGAEFVAEDDMDEEGEFEDEADGRAAAALGVRMARTIRNNPEAFLGWYRFQLEEKALEIGG